MKFDDMTGYMCDIIIKKIKEKAMCEREMKTKIWKCRQ